MRGNISTQFHFIQYIFYIKTTTNPYLKLPRVTTPKPVSAPTRVSPSTIQYFHNISPTTQNHCRALWAVKAKNTPKTSHLTYPWSKFRSNPCRISHSLDNTDADFTTINLPSKLQHLVQEEIKHASDTFINHIIKINAVLDVNTDKTIE